MKVNFQIVPLQSSSFDSFKLLADSELQQMSAKWIEVDEYPGFPCRVSLEDARVGERVLALCFAHHQANSPYRGSGPIFVREHAKQASPAVNEIPRMLRRRLLSVRGYNSDGIMLAAEVTDGAVLEVCITEFFLRPEIEYIHIHNAKPGCFNCCVIRA